MTRKKATKKTEAPAPKTTPRVRLWLVAGLSAVGVALASWLTWIHVALLGSPDAASACNLGGALDCDAVNSSRFSTLAGVPIAWFGLTAYLALLTLTVRDLRAAGPSRALAYARWFGLGAVLYSVYLAIVSVVVIEAVCAFCVGLYVVNLGILIASFGASATSLADLKPSRNLGILFRSRWLLGALGAWLAGGVALAAVERNARGLELPTVSLGQAAVVGVAPGQVAGPDDAPLTVVLFGDFECPHCRTASASLDSVRVTHGGRVRFVYKHFPLDPACNPSTPRGAHHHACDAAEAAVCAGEQGKFWEFHTAIFREGVSESELRNAAVATGLDARTWNRCRASTVVRDTVRADIDDGLRLGVRSTPTVLVGDELIRGGLAAEELIRRIEARLEAVRRDDNRPPSVPIGKTE